MTLRENDHRDPDCIFCSIVAGDVPATVVARSPRAVAFQDVAPKAPVHVLVVPVTHVRDVTELAAHDPELLGEVVTLAREVADELAGGEFRLVFNTGPAAGQTVFHAHGHVLAAPGEGAGLAW